MTSKKEVVKLMIKQNINSHEFDEIVKGLTKKPSQHNTEVKQIILESLWYLSDWAITDGGRM